MTYCGRVWTFLGAKRLECVELAPAFGSPTLNDSASKLDALQTLRVTGMLIFLCVSAFRAVHTKARGRRGGLTVMPRAGGRRGRRWSRNALGDTPVLLLKTRLKSGMDWNPAA